jgi:hypothetical protein
LTAAGLVIEEQSPRGLFCSFRQGNLRGVTRRISILHAIDAGATLLAVAAIVWFVWFNAAVISASGIASADDGYFSIIAKSFAAGRGYGLPESSEHVRLFDPSNGSGPGLIFPLAAATILFGAHSWTPGMTVLGLFTVQILALCALLWRDGAPLRGVAAFLTLTLALIATVSRHTWVFSFGVGEPVALGWLLLGTAFLFGSRPVPAGLLFSLALLTKSISALAIGPIGLVWLAQKRDLRAAVHVGTAALVLPIAFELYRVIVLGFEGYAANMRSTLAFIGYGGIDDTGGPRLARFVERAGRLLTHPGLAALVLVAAAPLASRRRLPLFVGLLAGGIFSLGYVAMVGRIEVARYWWIALACLCTAAAVPALIALWRGAAVAMLALLLIPDLRDIPSWAAHTLAAQRIERLAEQQTAITARAVALRWPVLIPSNTTFEIIYLLPDGFPWRQTHELEALTGAQFLFVARRHFSGDGDRVFAARDLCEPEGAWPSYEVRHCGDRFWAARH